MGKRDNLFLTEQVVDWAEGQVDKVFSSTNPIGLSQVDPTAVQVLLHRDLVVMEERQTKALEDLASAIVSTGNGNHPPKPRLLSVERMKQESPKAGLGLLLLYYVLVALGVAPPPAV